MKQGSVITLSVSDSCNDFSTISFITRSEDGILMICAMVHVPVNNIVEWKGIVKRRWAENMLNVTALKAGCKRRTVQRGGCGHTTVRIKALGVCRFRVVHFADGS